MQQIHDTCELVHDGQGAEAMVGPGDVPVHAAVVEVLADGRQASPQHLWRTPKREAHEVKPQLHKSKKLAQKHAAEPHGLGACLADAALSPLQGPELRRRVQGGVWDGSLRGGRLLGERREGGPEQLSDLWGR